MDGTKKNVPRIDKDVTLSMFKKFADVEKIEDEVAEYIMLSGDAFWEYITKVWESNAHHAGRQHLEKSDIQLHMIRIGLAKNSSEFRDLIMDHLPKELVLELLKVAQAEEPSKSSSEKQLESMQDDEQDMDVNTLNFMKSMLEENNSEEDSSLETEDTGDSILNCIVQKLLEKTDSSQLRRSKRRRSSKSKDP